MKDRLIKFSKEKGFSSKDNLIEVSDSYYYLWMCELNEWLRIVYNIHVTIEPDQASYPKYCYSIKKYRTKQLDWENLLGIRNYSDLYRKYNEAFEIGLYHALKSTN